MRAPLIVFSVATALAATGCGGHPAHGRLHVTSLSLTAAVGFPGPPTSVTFDHGKAFKRAARLVPLPLPAVPASRPPSAKHPSTLTVCFPMDLTIGLSNGKKVAYPSCFRPRSLRPVVAALCPLLHKPGFCAFYRNELE